MSGILHWLVSQSIFLANVKVIDRDGTPTTGGVTTCGYSPIAIIFALICAGFLLIFGISLGYRKLNPDMPVAASSSAAISAACHGPHGEGDAPAKVIQWGAVENSNFQWEEEVGHCCFSSDPVSIPVEGRLYAGASSIDGDDTHIRGRIS
jgi:hypothetical protein